MPVYSANISLTYQGLVIYSAQNEQDFRHLVKNSVPKDIAMLEHSSGHMPLLHLDLKYEVVGAIIKRGCEVESESAEELYNRWVKTVNVTHQKGWKHRYDFVFRSPSGTLHDLSAADLDKLDLIDENKSFLVSR